MANYVSIRRDRFRALVARFPKWQRADASAFWVEALFRANWKDGETAEWRDVLLLKRGQFPMGREEMGEQLGISPDRVRGVVDRLSSPSFGEVAVDKGMTTKRGTILTVVRYDYYVDDGRKIPQELPKRNFEEGEKFPKSSPREAPSFSRSSGDERPKIPQEFPKRPSKIPHSEDLEPETSKNTTTTSPASEIEPGSVSAPATESAVVAGKGQNGKPKTTPAAPASEIVKALTDFKLNPDMAQSLVRDFEEQNIRRVLDHAREKGKGPGFVVEALRKGWDLSDPKAEPQPTYNPSPISYCWTCGWETWRCKCNDACPHCGKASWRMTAEHGKKNGKGTLRCDCGKGDWIGPP